MKWFKLSQYSVANASGAGWYVELLSSYTKFCSSATPQARPNPELRNRSLVLT